MYHSFDADIAAKYGIVESLFLCNIAFWVKQNTLNKHNYFEGRYWTYNSLSAYAGLFYYVSESTIKRAIKHLKDEGLIYAGNFNNDRFNHTNYYTLTDKGYALIKNPTDRTGQNDLIETTYSDLPLFNKNTDSADNKHTVENKHISCVISPDVAEKEAMFEEFWKAYPQCFRKVNKKGSKVKFLNIKNLKELFPTIMRSLEIQKQSKQWNEQDGKFIPLPTTWINEERWTVTDTRTEKQALADEAASDFITNMFGGTKC